MCHSGEPICKTLFYGDITLGQHGFTNSKAFTVFLFPYFAYLPFFSKPPFCPWFAYRSNHIIDFISFAVFVEELKFFFMAPWGVKLSHSLLGSITSKVFNGKMVFLWANFMSLDKQEYRHIISFWSQKKKRFPVEFWKKENGDRLEIKIPILT